MIFKKNNKEKKRKNTYKIYSKKPLYFSIYRSNSDRISSGKDLFQCVLPHFSQTKYILVCPFLISYILGNIFAQQLSNAPLSQGVCASTCCEVKQKGQWLRQVFSAIGTCFQHCKHINDSLIFFIFHIIFQSDILD